LPGWLFCFRRSAYYILSITNQGASTYTLNATPTGTTTSDSCGTLTLDHERRYQQLVKP